MHLIKKCGRCKNVKSLEQFVSDKSLKSGYSCYCKDCKKVSRFRYLYGLSAREANELISRGCEVCGSTESLRIDHCHTTGKVRGCLCNSCNIALGHLQDNPERIMRLAQYIESSKAVLP